MRLHAPIRSASGRDAAALLRMERLAPGRRKELLLSGCPGVDQGRRTGRASRRPGRHGDGRPRGRHPRRPCRRRLPRRAIRQVALCGPPASTAAFLQPFAPNFRNVLAILRGQRSAIARSGDRGRRPLRPHRLRRPRAEPRTVRIRSPRRRRQRQRHRRGAGIGQGVHHACPTRQAIDSVRGLGRRGERVCWARSIGSPIPPFRWSTSWRP